MGTRRAVIAPRRPSLDGCCRKGSPRLSVTSAILWPSPSPSVRGSNQDQPVRDCLCLAGRTDGSPGPWASLRSLLTHPNGKIGLHGGYHGASNSLSQRLSPRCTRLFPAASQAEANVKVPSAVAALTLRSRSVGVLYAKSCQQPVAATGPQLRPEFKTSETGPTRQTLFIQQLTNFPCCNCAMHLASGLFGAPDSSV